MQEYDTLRNTKHDLTQLGMVQELVEKVHACEFDVVIAPPHATPTLGCLWQTVAALLASGQRSTLGDFRGSAA